VCFFVFCITISDRRFAHDTISLFFTVSMIRASRIAYAIWCFLKGFCFKVACLGVFVIGFSWGLDGWRDGRGKSMA
jgi:hypothetical protein